MSRGAPEPLITGALVSRHLELLAEMIGSAELSAVLSSLSPEVREAFEGVVAASWVKVTDYAVFYDAAARRAGRDVAELHTELSRKSVELAFRTIWRILLRLTTDEALVSRTPIMYSRAYTHGKLTAVIPKPGVATLELREWPDVPDIVLRGVRVATEGVLAIAGRRGGTVTYQRSREGATFHARWGGSAAPSRTPRAP